MNIFTFLVEDFEAWLVYWVGVERALALVYQDNIQLKMVHCSCVSSDHNLTWFQCKLDSCVCYRETVVDVNRGYLQYTLVLRDNCHFRDPFGWHMQINVSILSSVLQLDYLTIVNSNLVGQNKLSN